jgi:hypothetical protein
MHGKGKYKFKVINGILSWRNDEMERFMPVSPEILTRVILLYEKQLKTGIRIWKEIGENENEELSVSLSDPLFLELTYWMEQLQEIFANTDPFREKGKWLEGPIQLN